MSVEAFRLHFSGPLHIGRGATEMDRTEVVYHSDALKSALYAVGLSYFPEWESMPDAFFNGFRISSAFPFSGNELFLPKPFSGVKFDFAATAEEKKAKRAKKISFISSLIFQEWIKEREKMIPVQEAQVSPGGSFLFSSSHASHAFLHTEVQQRVQVPAEGDTEVNSRPFYFDRLYFEQGSGLYFLAQFNDPGIRTQVLYALAMLGTRGIGTDRTVGNGQFSFDAEAHITPFNMPEQKGNNLHLNLGLYLPGKEELSAVDLDKSYWQLLKRGGYIGGSSFEKFLSLRKNSVYFFAEGSVFQSNVTLNGRYINLKPEYNDRDLHPVYRCGQPLFITI